MWMLLIMVAYAVDFAPGAKINVCWRTFAGDNPFAVSGDFECANDPIVAIDAPFPGGGLTGRQITDFVKTKVPQAQEMLARSVKAGEDPKKSKGSISVGDEEMGFYNNYVVADGDGFRLYVDVQVPK